jgi:hypothetical protein
MINFTKIFVLFLIFIILYCLSQSNITSIYANEYFQENNNHILFMHFHKAGGTTINNMANKMKKFPQNKLDYELYNYAKYLSDNQMKK